MESAEDALKGAGLPPLAWYDVLHELAEAGEGGLRPFQLIERTLFAQYNISRLLARLEADGFVEKLPVAYDGRGQTIRITARGRDAPPDVGCLRTLDRRPGRCQTVGG